MSMKQKLISGAAIKALGLGLIVAAGVSPVTAAPTVSGSSGNAAYSVSSTDLINGSNAVVTSGTLRGEEGMSNAVSVLTNGSFGAADLTQATQVLSISNGTVLTYTLNTSINTLGYSISAINTYSGWRDPGRDNQDYTVSFATVDAPTTFTQVAAVSYNPGNIGTPADTFVSIIDSSGYLGTRVSAIRFNFAQTENGYVGYRELDVMGTAVASVPEPATALMSVMGLAIVGLRRRKQLRASN